MSCGAGHRHSLDLVLLWLWGTQAATAPTGPLAWEKKIDTRISLFTAVIAKTWKPPIRPLRHEWLKKMLCVGTRTHIYRHTHTHTHTQEYYSAIKNNEIMPFAATWMDPEIIILSKVDRRNINTIRYHLYVESKIGTYLRNKKTRRHKGQTCGCQGGGGGGEGWPGSVGSAAANWLCPGWINNKAPLRSPGSHSQHLVINYTGKKKNKHIKNALRD